MVVGLFRDYEEASAAVHDLHREGFSRREVSLASREGSKALLEPKDERIGGAGAGAALGGATGMILGLAALAVPGIGPVVAAGPLAASLAGAGIGAATGGMIGALSNLGIPESEAGTLAEAIRRGVTLVSVRCDEHDVGKAEAILSRHGALDIDQHAAAFRNGHWTADDPHASTPTYGEEGSPSEYSGVTSVARPVRVYECQERASSIDNEFRRHFETTFFMRGGYEEFSEAYHYGHALGSDERFVEADWHAVEPEARSAWERMHPGTWERMKDAVRHAWDYVRGHQRTASK